MTDGIRPDYDDKKWQKAKIVGEFRMRPVGTCLDRRAGASASEIFTEGILVRKPVRRATIYATALGLYELHINGEKISDAYFTPGWTDYDNRVYYNTYDVTAQIQSGGNAIGAILGDGWYAGYVGWGHVREHYGNKTRFCAQLAHRI